MKFIPREEAAQPEPKPKPAAGGLGLPPSGAAPLPAGGAGVGAFAAVFGAAGTVADMLESARLGAYVDAFHSEGYEFAEDLVEEEDATVEELLTTCGMKRPERRRFAKVMELAAGGSDGDGGSAAAAAAGGGDSPAASAETQAKQRQAKAAAEAKVAAEAAAAAAEVAKHKALMEEQAAALQRQQSELNRSAAALQAKQDQMAEAQRVAEQEAASVALARKLHEEEQAAQAAAAAAAAATVSASAEPEPELEPEPGQVAAAAASGSFEDTDAWWGAVAQGYDPAKLQKIRKACRADTLDFHGARIGDDGARILGAALAAMPRPLPYRQIILNYNELTDAGMEAIARGMHGGFSQLWMVKVLENQIGDAGFVALAAALPPTLKNFDMNSNQCGDVGMVAVVEALSRCTELDALEFYCNRVGAAGFAAVAEALPRWPKLERLIVYRNPGPADALALALIKALEADVAFWSVDCNKTGLSEAVHQQLRAAFEASGKGSLTCD
eukprot:COSAG06_NODE_117_length_23226_cov_167.478488_8_plen_499_part_00